MADIAHVTEAIHPLKRPIPAWIGAGIIGLALGAGVTLLAVRLLEPSPGDPSSGAGYFGSRAAQSNNLRVSGATYASGPTSSWRGYGMSAGSQSGKRNLTTLVWRLELLTRSDLRIQLTPEQAAQISKHLVEVEFAEQISDDDAQLQFEAIEGLLSPEQKAVVDSVEWPYVTGGMRGPSGSLEGVNPFRQEPQHHERLNELLTRIQPTAFDPNQ